MSFNEAKNNKAIVVDISDTEGVLQHVRDNPGCRGREIAKTLGYKPQLVEYILIKLENKGAVYTSRDDGAKAHYVVRGKSR